ncbi:MAG: SGNH/GDSL hydrolase family protein [Lachnospiraceae bacterium]|nr:SGNH/GDSL hydrolase family protein [Lachnospiraceae bacterium]
MKKQTYFCVAAIVTAFLILGAVAAYLTLNFGDSIFTGGKAESVPESDFHFETEGKTKETAAPETSQDHFLIWVGDSRTVGMQNAVKDDCLYIGASGEGYDWFISDGESRMRTAVKEHPDAPVVINLGVNDYDNMDLYMKRYRSVTEELSDTVFYFLSVNPIDPAICKNITNEQIADFNSHLQENFPDTYIDSFTYLMASEISPFDGVHYSEEAYQMLHDFVVQEIRQRSSTLS